MAKENESVESFDLSLSSELENSVASLSEKSGHAFSKKIADILDPFLNDAIQYAEYHIAERHIAKEPGIIVPVGNELAESYSNIVAPYVGSALSAIGLDPKTGVHSSSGVVPVSDVLLSVVQNFTKNVVIAMLRLGPPEQDSSPSFGLAEYYRWADAILSKISNQLSHGEKSGYDESQMLSGLTDLAEQLKNFVPPGMEVLMSRPESADLAGSQRVVRELRENSRLLTALEAFVSVVDLAVSGDSKGLSQLLSTKGELSTADAVQAAISASKARNEFSEYLLYLVTQAPNLQFYKLPDAAILMAYAALSHVVDAKGSPVISPDQYNNFVKLLSEKGRLLNVSNKDNRESGRLGYPELAKQMASDIFVSDESGAPVPGELKAASKLDSSNADLLKKALGLAFYGVSSGGEAYMPKDPSMGPSLTKVDQNLRIKPALYNLVKLYEAYLSKGSTAAVESLLSLAEKDAYSLDVLLSQIKNTKAPMLLLYAAEHPEVSGEEVLTKMLDMATANEFLSAMSEAINSDSLKQELEMAKYKGMAASRSVPEDKTTDLPKSTELQMSAEEKTKVESASESAKANMLKEFNSATLARQYADPVMQHSLEAAGVTVPDADLSKVSDDGRLEFLREVAALDASKLSEAITYFLSHGSWADALSSVKGKSIGDVLGLLKSLLGPAYSLQPEAFWKHIASKITKNTESAVKEEKVGGLSAADLAKYLVSLSSIIKEINDIPTLLESDKISNQLRRSLSVLMPAQVVGVLPDVPQLGYSEIPDISSMDFSKLLAVYQDIIQVLSQLVPPDADTAVSKDAAEAAVAELSAAIGKEKEQSSKNKTEYNKVPKEQISTSKTEEIMTQDNQPKSGAEEPELKKESAILTRHNEFNATGDGPWELHQSASGKKKLRKRNPDRIKRISRYLGGSSYSSFAEGEDVLYAAGQPPLVARVAAVSPEGLYEIVVESGDVYSDVPESDLVALDGSENIFE